MLASAVVLAWQFGAAQDHGKIEHPVMVDTNGPGTDLFVVDSSDTLHQLRISQNALQEYSKASLPAELTPADMTWASDGGQESVLIAGTESGRGVVVSFSLQNKSVKTWNFRNICSGIDFVSRSHSAYVATSDSNEIYRLDLQAAKPEYLTRIEDATKLGPVAFDETRQAIYVADVAAGRIYQYSIVSKTSKVLVTGLSAPTALVFDSGTNRLYVADPGLRAVLTIDPTSTKPTATAFASDPLRAPYGLTLISNGRVAVADYGANAMLIFSGKGEFLSRFPESK